MNKGKVIEINSKYAVLLNDNMNYEKIKYKKELILGSSVYYFKEDLYVKKQKHFSKIAIAAAILFMMVFIQPQTIDPIAFGYVSVDINPSVQMEVDKDLNVIKVEAKNEDAESIIKDEWIGKNFEEVIEEIIEIAQDKGILNETRDFILVSYYFEDEDIESEKKFEDGMNNLYENRDKQFEMAVVKSDEETIKESKNNGESFGRKTIRKKIDKEVSDLLDIKEDIKKNRDVTVYSNNKNGMPVQSQKGKGNNNSENDKGNSDNNKGNGKDTGNDQNTEVNNNKDNEKDTGNEQNTEVNNNKDNEKDTGNEQNTEVNNNKGNGKDIDNNQNTEVNNKEKGNSNDNGNKGNNSGKGKN
ncbi:hypothetical protein QUF55_04030 [Clostridiaceae bacterium HSG29]|nr:hypothetical protein [Clostridiaceae bacterium HSG29]